MLANWKWHILNLVIHYNNIVILTKWLLQGYLVISHFLSLSLPSLQKHVTDDLDLKKKKLEIEYMSSSVGPVQSSMCKTRNQFEYSWKYGKGKRKMFVKQ